MGETIDIQQSEKVGNNLTLENFAKLEDTITRLEDDKISLEEAFTAYKQGMDLLKSCNEQIDKVEKQVIVLSEEYM